MSIAKIGAKAVGKTIKWTFFGALGLIVLVIVLAIVGLGKASHDSEKSAAKITEKAFASVHIGTRATAVRKRFGTPERTDQTEITGFKQTCWYYGILSSKGSYQFCFEKGKLAVKNRF